MSRTDIPPTTSRRAILCALGSTVLSISLAGRAAAGLRSLAKTVRIGMIADLHHDIMHDGEARLDAFLQEMAASRPDALLQLGDFAYPHQKNRSVIDRFNRAHPVSLHVIGNHDTDAGHSKQQCLDVWGMPGRYYHQDLGGLRLLVLDGNDRGSPGHQGGYPSFVGAEQLDWMRQQLEAHDGPLVVLSHQPLAGPAAVDNAGELQKLLGIHADKVLICINGHSHVDSLVRRMHIPYLHVNSASYRWVGGAHKHRSYPQRVHDQHSWINHTCPYRDPLFATVTFDSTSGEITVAGRESAWVGKSPAALGVDAGPQERNGREVVPMIRDRRIPRSGT